MISRRTRSLLTATVVLGLIAAACGDDDDGDVASPTTDQPATSTTEATTTTTTAEDAPADETTTTLPLEASPYSRIVVSGSSLLDAALALDLEVAGIPGRNDRDSIPPYLVDRVGEIEVLAPLVDVNIEELAAFEPDFLLFATGIVDAAGDGVLDNIAEVGAVDFGTFTPWRDGFLDVAEAVGLPERGAARLADTEARIEAARAELTDEQRAIEVSIVRCLSERCRYLPGGTSFPGQVLDDLGVARPEIQRSDDEGRPFVDVSPEFYNLLGGDIIILYGTDADETLAGLADNSLWSGLEAVQNDLVFEVASDPWFAGSVLAVEYIVDDVVEILGSL